MTTEDDSEYRERVIQEAEWSVLLHERHPSRDVAWSATHMISRLIRRGLLSEASQRVQRAAMGFLP